MSLVKRPWKPVKWKGFCTVCTMFRRVNKYTVCSWCTFRGKWQWEEVKDKVRNE